jgi:hypothetical protein
MKTPAWARKAEPKGKKRKSRTFVDTSGLVPFLKPTLPFPYWVMFAGIFSKRCPAWVLFLTHPKQCNLPWASLAPSMH